MYCWTCYRALTLTSTLIRYTIRDENSIYYFDVRTLRGVPYTVDSVHRRSGGRSSSHGSGSRGGDSSYHGTRSAAGSRNERKQRSTLVAFYPAVIEGVGGVFMSLGRDGVRWSAPELLIASPILNDRTPDHPAGLTWHEDGSVALWVLHNVDLTTSTHGADLQWRGQRAFNNGEVHCRCTPRYPPVLCRYALDGLGV